MNFEVITHAATGQWPMIFAQLGIDMPKRGKHGPCPICGAGVDRLHFDDLRGNGTWHCRKCDGKQAGTGLTMVHLALGVSYPTAALMVANVLGLSTHQQC